jgi:hypothetical protein
VDVIATFVSRDFIITPFEPERVIKAINRLFA